MADGPSKPSDPPSPVVHDRCLVADLRQLFQRETGISCDVCGASLDEGDEPSHAALLWTRGVERRTEELPLCPQCVVVVGVNAYARFRGNDDEG